MSTALLEKRVAVTAEGYRAPMTVTQLRRYGSAYYYVCPRCKITLDREFMAYCDRCGQCLNWKNYRKAVIIEM